ncbi:MFS transporter [Dactylosporangium darangshiense]|uniref:MFS transporter n=1 Tax=Dactylosporangium darangshiense TaxID=579108 RepID=A0ABP8DW64_9ACTN
MVVFFLAGSSAPTPLYALYQAEWGFSPIVTAVVFGVYAIAVLVALLLVGSLSDYIGRRPVLFTSAVVQAATMVLFANTNGVAELAAARIVQGLATGAAVSAVGAGLIDIDRVRGTIANAIAPMTGTAVGALGSALLVRYLPAPTHLVYYVLAVLFIIQAVGVVFMAETVTPKAGALASLRIDVDLPPDVRGAFLRVAPALIAVWALAGFYASLGPALVHGVVGSSAVVLGGSALFVLAGSAALTVPTLRSAAPRRTMRLGTCLLIGGVAITLAGVAALSSVIFFIGTAVAGAGFGAGFQGGIRTVLPLAKPDERSGVLSVLYLVSYLGLGVPSVAAGVLVAHGERVATAATQYGVVVMALAGLALAGTFARAAAPTRPNATTAAERGVPNARSVVGVDVCADALCGSAEAH